MFHEIRNFVTVSGKGGGKTELNAFDSALVDAGVGNYNLVRLSSILPPNTYQGCTIQLSPGSLLPIAYGTITSNKENTCVAASVGVGIPKDRSSIGVIMEYSTSSCELISDEFIKSRVENMVVEAMESRQIKFDTILVASSISYKPNTEYHSAFSGIALW